MAKYRQVHISFWQDGFVLDLTPEEKYFYLYLMTNSKTSQCGIYELPKRIIETETGYNRDTVDKLLKRFEDYGKILYDQKTKEIMIINWVKYNWINSSKVISLINKELKEVKNPIFIKTFIESLIRYEYPIDTISIPHPYCMDSLGIKVEREVEVEREREQEVEEGKNPATTTENSIVLFEKLLCRISPRQSESLYKWLDDFNGQTEIINEAIMIADNKNKRYFGFVEFLLKEWFNNKLDSLDRVRAYEQEKFNKAKSPNGSGKKATRTELLPDWFDKDPYQQKTPTVTPDLLEKQKELNEMLKEIREPKEA